MKHVALICSTVFLLFCPSSLAAQSEFASVDAFLKSTVKGEARLSDVATGDLNGDGLRDWVGVIHRQPADGSPTNQLFVLLRLAQGGFQLAEKSKEEEIPGMGCCWLENLEIRRSSIYIQNNAKTATVMEAVTHQFKLYQGQWRLVGITNYVTDHGPDTPSTFDQDFNLLTGLVIEKRQKGERRPVTKSQRRKFSVLLLKDFDFSTTFGIE